MILTVAAIVAQASPAPAVSASPAAAAASPLPAATLPPNPKVDEAAKAWLLSLQQGKQLAGAPVTKAMGSLFTADNIKMIQNMLGTATLTSFDLKDSGARGALNIYVYRAAFSNNKAFAFIYELDSKGRVAGMRIIPGR